MEPNRLPELGPSDVRAKGRCRAILSALREPDADLAAQAMADHITTAGAQIARFVERQSSETVREVVGTPEQSDSLAGQRRPGP